MADQFSGSGRPVKFWGPNPTPTKEVKLTNVMKKCLAAVKTLSKRQNGFFFAEAVLPAPALHQPPEENKLGVELTISPHQISPIRGNLLRNLLPVEYTDRNLGWLVALPAPTDTK